MDYNSITLRRFFFSQAVVAHDFNSNIQEALHTPLPEELSTHIPVFQ